MTPSTIFQWPLSPLGTFQPVKSLPLKRETKPSCAGPASAVMGAKASAAQIGRRKRRRVMGRSPVQKSEVKDQRSVKEKISEPTTCRLLLAAKRPAPLAGGC